MPATHLALLRGINVGGKNMLPMKTLERFFVDAGCDCVRTYIQSGNVLFDADKATCSGLCGKISLAIEKGCGFRPAVVLRTASELANAVANNPFLSSGMAAESLHLMFLADKPAARRVDALDPTRSLPDEFRVNGSEVYLHLPNGAGRTKLTNNYFDSTLATTSTARNWRTVTKLLDLMQT
jgi:uncharacterized protein (DUF1697 family)